MLFNSYTFWLFYSLVFVLYRLLPHRAQNRLLLVASYVFYGFWDWRFLSLIIFSTVVDYYVGLGLATTKAEPRRRRLLLVSVGANLGLLGIFKYYGFFSQELAVFLQEIGIPFLLPSLDIVLPVGISFYTFQTMSYTIDVYRGDTQPTHRFLDFALYVSFFPQLVAGPIERSSRLLPQILNPRHHPPGQFSEGLYLVMTGLFKKVVIADNMAMIVDTIFQAEPGSLTGLEVLLGVYAFAFQIYGDFSGYSSIARGIAKWMGIDLMVNFNMPYFADSPSDFWKRWHISLSTWLRDYLYIPLGGNRNGVRRTYRNLMLTMGLGGLWHGAGWTFVIWGVFHGLLLCGYRIFDRADRGIITPARGRIHASRKLIRMFVMFQWVCLGWLFFRAETMAQVWGMVSQMLSDFHMTPFALGILGLLLFYAGPLVFYEGWVYRRNDLMAITKVHWGWRGSFYGYCVLMLFFFPPPVRHEFIYFQF